MSRSQRAEREERKYSSARSMAEKMGAGYSATYLKLPDGKKFYKHKVGTALLDIIPFKAGEGNPMADEGVWHCERTFWVHRGIGANNESYLCPAKNFKDSCPICEKRQQLAQDEDEDSDKLRKELAPKERQLFNVFDRKDPDKGVQLMDYSSFLFGQVLLARILSGEEEDHWELFFSIEDGYTLRVVWEEDTIGRGQKFIKAQSIDFKERKDGLDDDLIDEAAPLDELLVPVTYKELKKNFLAAKKDEDEDEPKSRREKDEDDEKPKRRRDEDEDEKPKSRRDREEDDEKPKRRDREEDDEKPKSRREKDEDDEKEKGKDDWDDDKPKRRHDEDEDEKPKRRHDEDEDEKPKSRKRDEDEDEKPKRRRDEDDEKPKGKKEEDDGWDDFDKKPKRRDEDEDEKPKRKRDED